MSLTPPPKFNAFIVWDRTGSLLHFFVVQTQELFVFLEARIPTIVISIPRHAKSWEEFSKFAAAKMMLSTSTHLAFYHIILNNTDELDQLPTRIDVSNLVYAQRYEKWPNKVWDGKVHDVDAVPPNVRQITHRRWRFKDIEVSAFWTEGNVLLCAPENINFCVEKRTISFPEFKDIALEKYPKNKTPTGDTLEILEFCWLIAFSDVIFDYGKYKPEPGTYDYGVDYLVKLPFPMELRELIPVAHLTE